MPSSYRMMSYSRTYFCGPETVTSAELGGFIERRRDWLAVSLVDFVIIPQREQFGFRFWSGLAFVLGSSPFFGGVVRFIVEDVPSLLLFRIVDSVNSSHDKDGRPDANIKHNAAVAGRRFDVTYFIAQGAPLRLPLCENAESRANVFDLNEDEGRGVFVKGLFHAIVEAFGEPRVNRVEIRGVVDFRVLSESTQNVVNEGSEICGIELADVCRWDGSQVIDVR